MPSGRLTEGSPDVTAIGLSGPSQQESEISDWTSVPRIVRFPCPRRNGLATSEISGVEGFPGTCRETDNWFFDDFYGKRILPGVGRLETANRWFRRVSHQQKGYVGARARPKQSTVLQESKSRGVHSGERQNRDS